MKAHLIVLISVAIALCSFAVARAEEIAPKEFTNKLTAADSKRLRIEFCRTVWPNDYQMELRCQRDQKAAQGFENKYVQTAMEAIKSDVPYLRRMGMDMMRVAANCLSMWTVNDGKHVDRVMAWYCIKEQSDAQSELEK